MDPNVEEIHKMLQEQGFYFYKDDTFGEKVEQVSRGSDYITELGADFLENYCTKHPVISKLLNALFPETLVGWCNYMSANEPTVFCWAKKYESSVRVLCLQFYKTNSEAIFFVGSHLKQLEYMSGEYGVFEIPEDSIKQDGITERKVTMPHGGLVIFDARLPFRLSKGGSINIGCGLREAVTWRKWQKFVDLTEEEREKLKNRFAAAETSTIKIHIDLDKK